MKKNYLRIFLFFIVFCCFGKIHNIYAKDADGNIVVVIDPGHGGLAGGADEGASYNGVDERHINITVANAMYEELTKYNGVKVFLTHDNPDISMSLSERADFAANVNADFLFSIHFNASENHNFYGTEVWIPSIGNFYTEGYKFANISLGELSSLGIFNRGIKTRVGEDNDEYYGIIRECEHRNINSVIIEHCHIDNNNDKKFFSSDEILCDMGKNDATAVAKYFNLKGTENDFSSYTNIDVETPQNRIYQDTTEPDLCQITVKKANKKEISFYIEAKDSDSYINYYSYSFDGGSTYSDVFEWNDIDGDGILDISITNVNVDIGKLIVKVYNKYDISAVSNEVNVAEFIEEETTLNNESEKNSSETTSDYNQTNSNSTKNSFAKEHKNQIIAIVIIIFGVEITFLLIKSLVRKRNK